MKVVSLLRVEFTSSVQLWALRIFLETYNPKPKPDLSEKVLKSSPISFISFSLIPIPLSVIVIFIIFSFDSKKNF